MPGFFIVPALVQSVLFFTSERRWFSSRELALGAIAGVLNGGSTFCLLMAARDSDPSMRAILFPLFAVTVIFLCNLWGKRFYKESINWKGMTLCLAGVFIGSL
jgi:drug/metabolite transporter (DMT)-like permease